MQIQYAAPQYSSPSNMCTKHSIPLITYCSDCKQFMCPTCQSLDLPGHHQTAIQLFANILETEISKQTVDLNAAIEQRQNYLALLDQMCKDRTPWESHLSQEGRVLLEKVSVAIEQKKRELLTSLQNSQTHQASLFRT